MLGRAGAGGTVGTRLTLIRDSGSVTVRRRSRCQYETSTTPVRVAQNLIGLPYTGWVIWQ